MLNNIIDPVDSGNSDEVGNANESAIVSGMVNSIDDIEGDRLVAKAESDSDSINGDDIFLNLGAGTTEWGMKDCEAEGTSSLRERLTVWR
ncbi:hypothetical protein J5X98_19470 [Leptothermofonsia sichuanensis E412]|uniref:hypothetical protein n=1 Tax=Leptothermofonsia sichuanensis TaxID=2917832 RepID=UPI001CA5FBC7|nr:hypothetical protein [Leptothermofonsia sichuanensis]QZZ19512.1 hypothetical protein J5X98_19470 [Leptothermofonsia sichuanensis E412]